MDFTPVIAQVLGMLIWFIPAVFLIALLKSPWAKGHIGELLVRFFAHRQLDEQTYRRLHTSPWTRPAVRHRSITSFSRCTASSCWKRRT